MNIQTVRAELKEWLSGLIRIDVFDIDEPRQLYTTTIDGQGNERQVPANCAVSYPVKDLAYERHGTGSVTGSGLFIYTIVYKYKRDLNLNELPVSELEGLVQYLHVQAILTLGGCGAIRSLEIEPDEFPIQISRSEASAGQEDWLVHVHLQLRIDFALTDFDISPDFAIAGPEFADADTDLNIQVFRSKQGALLTQNTLDSEFILQARPQS